MLRKAIVVVIGVLAGNGANAGFIPWEFDFDAMAYRSSAAPGPNSAVQTYMQSILPGVLVTGAGQLSNNRYTGDGHVVGPDPGSVAATLGSTDGGVQGAATLHTIDTGANLDNYVVNHGADRITIAFPEPIYSVSFDYAIFPNGQCPNPASINPNQNKGCTSTASAKWPDFTFLADGFLQFQTFGTLPGSAGTYLHSPISGAVNTEKAPQYLGVSGFHTFTGGVTKLEFVDWPQRIGIDNLRVETCCTSQQVPEPGGLALIAAAVSGVVMFIRRRRHV